ncbi:hypothetical protein ACFFSY_09940 [Paenibacillus aurantiacus]|uniref:Uncharacterized protein n=1 Tax=Paenibacillus aurantiacus TaxID=1936118 RepID=A0ABV5KLW3_9BACL
MKRTIDVRMVIAQLGLEHKYPELRSHLDGRVANGAMDCGRRQCASLYAEARVQECPNVMGSTG